MGRILCKLYVIDGGGRMNKWVYAIFYDTQVCFLKTCRTDNLQYLFTNTIRVEGIGTLFTSRRKVIDAMRRTIAKHNSNPKLYRIIRFKKEMK
jgi:hypothetical protein